MQLPTIGKGSVQSLGSRSPSEVSVESSSAEQVGKLLGSASKLIQSYVKNKDEQNTKNLGVELISRLSSAKAQLSENDNISKDTLSEIGIKNFDSDSRAVIPAYEAIPFVNKSIVDNFVSEKGNTFSNKKLGVEWGKDITIKGLMQFNNDLADTNKIIRQNKVVSLKSDIDIAQDKGAYNVASALIKQLPKDEQKVYNHDNGILEEQDGIANQIASGTDEQLNSTLDYLGSKDYEGMPTNERNHARKAVRAELSKRSSITKSKKKSEDIVISRAISELSKSIKKGDQNSFEAVAKFSSKIPFDSMSKKQQLDLRTVQALTTNILELRAITSSSDRDDYVSNKCKSGDINCNAIKSIQKQDLVLMKTDPMQYAMNAKMPGIETIDFENDTDVKIASSIIERIKSKETITQYIGHESALVTNNEAVQFNAKLKNMEPEERVSNLSSMLNLVGDESFIMLSEQVSGKINSNYYIAKSLMLGEPENATSISKGNSLKNLISNELKGIISATATKELWDRSEFIPGAIDAVTSLIAYEISKDGDYKDASIEAKDSLYFENDVDTVEEYFEQVIGRKENIHGSIITLPNLKITNGEMQSKLNNIDPESLDVPFNKDISQKDISDGLKSSSLSIDLFSDSKYILKDSSIPGTWFVVDRTTSIPVRGQNNKAYKIKFDNIIELVSDSEKDKKLFKKLEGQPI